MPKGDKPLSEPIKSYLRTDIATRGFDELMEPMPPDDHKPVVGAIDMKIYFAPV